MTSLAHHWEQQGLQKGLAILEAKLQEERITGETKLQEERKIAETKLQQERITTAKNWLKAGVSMDLIASSTGLTKEQLKKLN